MKRNFIGFMSSRRTDEQEAMSANRPEVTDIAPKKSVVSVYFPERHTTLSYYNDRFDLHKGDLVYVDGALEGLRGLVTAVSYTFKIKLSQYKKVVAVVDRNAAGTYYFAGSHLLTFDREALPFERVRTWFQAPVPEEEYAVGEGSGAFPLDAFEQMGFSYEIAERGKNYYAENRVCYLSVDGTQGKAIVSGHEYYTVEFTYKNSEISDLVCSCFCNYPCKHAFACILQLKECLGILAENYADKADDYFAAISKGAWLEMVFNGQQTGKIRLYDEQ
ncbi:MAG: SWIM zinc finger family protein [Eubacteriales bacterium]|jgi:hypothetical protein